MRQYIMSGDIYITTPHNFLFSQYLQLFIEMQKMFVVVEKVQDFG